MITPAAEKAYYRHDIDGLRAIAVISVILFHFNPKILPGGFLGVDVFFVISGYLITGILIRESQEAGICFKAFWIRRIKRLLPAFSVMALLTCLTALVLMPFTLAEAAAKQSIATFVASSNWYLWRFTNDYWGQSAESAPLLHTWSLSVEEQFYVLFPFLIWAGLRFFGRRMASAGFALLAVGAFLYSLQLGRAEPSQAFYLATGRAWELMAGVLLALLGDDLPDFFDGKWTQALGLVLIATSVCVVDGGTFAPATGAFCAVLGAVLVCVPRSSPAACQGLLAGKFITYIGRASYSLYLWHWPVLVFAAAFELAWPGHAFRGVALVIGLTLGLLSFHWVEPLGRASSFPRRIAPVLFAASLACALLIFLNRELPERPPPLRGAATRGNEADVYLVGDSHAESLAPALEAELAKAGRSLISGASSGDGLVPGVARHSQTYLAAWRKTNEQRLSYITEHKPRCVVISCRWEKYASYEEMSGTREFIDKVMQLNPGGRIVVIGQPPFFSCGEFRPREWSAWVKKIGAPEAGTRWTPRHAFAQDNLVNACSERGLSFVDSRALFAAMSTASRPACKLDELYVDSNHVSQRGAAIISAAAVHAVVSKN